MESLKKLEEVIDITKETKFDEILQDKEYPSRQIIEENMTKLDNVSQNEDKQFTGGCSCLLK